MATYSSIVSWRILWTEEPGGLLSMGLHRVRHDWSDLACMHAYIGEGNGNPLQYSCLENPRDREAWWAAIYGVAQNWTWLKRLSSNSLLLTVQLLLFGSQLPYTKKKKKEKILYKNNLLDRLFFFPKHTIWCRSRWL